MLKRRARRKVVYRSTVDVPPGVSSTGRHRRHRTCIRCELAEGSQRLLYQLFRVVVCLRSCLRSARTRKAALNTRLFLAEDIRSKGSTNHMLVFSDGCRQLFERCHRIPSMHRRAYSVRLVPKSQGTGIGTASA